MNIYILCGLPGSGKSTWAKKKADETGALIVNRDSIRTMFFGSYKFDAKVEYIVKNCAESIIRELIDCNINDIIIDECNLDIQKRKHLTDLINANVLSEYNVNVVIVWFTENERNTELRSNDNLRGYTKQYWEDIILGMKNIFEPPTENEDVDEIIEVKI